MNQGPISPHCPIVRKRRGRDGILWGSLQEGSYLVHTGPVRAGRNQPAIEVRSHMAMAITNDLIQPIE